MRSLHYGHVDRPVVIIVNREVVVLVVTLRQESVLLTDSC